MQQKRHKITNKTAEQKALEILNYSMRSEFELREKLSAFENFSQEDIDRAIEYVSYYGYLNDALYAEMYVEANTGKKGRNAIKIGLQRKGISQEYIDDALEAMEEPEEEVAYSLLIQKAGGPHELEDKEYAKLCRFLAGRGFSGGTAYTALKRYANRDYE